MWKLFLSSFGCMHLFRKTLNWIDPWGQELLLNCSKNWSAICSWENPTATTNNYFKRNKWACHSSYDYRMSFKGVARQQAFHVTPSYWVLSLNSANCPMTGLNPFPTTTMANLVGAHSIQWDEGNVCYLMGEGKMVFVPLESTGKLVIRFYILIT